MAMRIRFSFSKTRAMQFTSHLDLMRTWERALRRAELPLSYSQGFNPRPKITFAAPLPLGWTSETEVMDVWFKDEELELAVILERITQACPPGILVHEIHQVDNTLPKLPTILRSMEYSIELPQTHPDLGNKIQEFLHADSIIREKRGKEYDLRELVEMVELKEDGSVIFSRFSAIEGKTGRPDELLKELGIDPHKTHIHRKKLLFLEKQKG